MNDEQDPQAAVRRRMDELRLQFVKRTLGELGGMSDLLERVRQGDVPALRELELLAHKINGTGATFGFTGISSHAGDIERMVAPEKTPGGGPSFASPGERADRIAVSLARLRAEVQMLAAESEK
jgi:hypothetical protein